ncbi:hypothetical protein GYA54_03470 [Candidatus Kuenenbacteria bacterium]|nr:hypothetical protein [Candidatus Kuenenbacteria bacterium]
MKPKIILLILLVIIIAGAAMFFNIDKAGAQEKLPVYFFWGDGCPHCHEEQIFWETIKDNYPEIDWISYETWKNTDNQALLLKMTRERTGKAFGSVPVTIIGEKIIYGFGNENTTGQQIIKALDIYTGRTTAEMPGQKTKENKYHLPLIGEVDIQKLSLPVLTIVLGAVDGFNPCSMWALLVLITLLINSGSKKKMWLVGWTYIIASSISYFLFLTAWLNTFLVIGYIVAIRIIIGILAIGVGIYFFRDYLKNRKKNDLTCEVTSTETKSKIISRLEKILQKEKTLGIIAGITLIAFSINLIELLCSAGIPAVYTQILSQNNISSGGRYLYLLIYDFFYMLDDIVVLLIAGFSWKLFVGNKKYAKYSHLIGGLLLFILGAIMIFSPNLLMVK